MARHFLMSAVPLGLCAAALASAAPLAAQTIANDSPPPYTPLTVGTPSTAPEAGDASDARRPATVRGRARGEARGPARARVDVTPYIEVSQVLTGEFGNGGDVLTYSTVAVGLEASVATRRAQAAVDVRYERRISSDDPLLDNDVISGLARGRYDIASGLAIEGGALASRASVDGRGGTADFVTGDRSNVANIYSVYAGPTFGRTVGDVDLGAAYRFGYSRSDIEFGSVLPGSSTTRVGSFEDSTNHAAIASIGMRPGRLPFGWIVSGGFEQESAGQLDQRYRAWNVRGDINVPISPTVALLGGIGYEDIELSQRSPLLGAGGVPVIDRNGRLVSDTSLPRLTAFSTDGLIYDAGVLWRPNRRMSLEARVGRRYGDTIYTGSWSWQASADTSLQLGVYDGLTSIGRQLSSSLAALPTDFEVFRSPIDSSLGGCAFGTSGAAAGTCLSPTLANASGFAFRNRGVVFSVASRQRPWDIGLALGYDRRRYLARGIVGIPGLDGTVDETWFAYATASRQISRRTAFGSSLYATYFDSGLDGASDALSAGGTASLSHVFVPRLIGNASVAVNAIDQDGFNTRVFGSALLGLRYSF